VILTTAGFVLAAVVIPAVIILLRHVGSSSK
jgi:hypothetical protein